MDYKIPKEVFDVLDKIEKAGHEAYLVGGCVRDLLRGAKPKDWDITTNAKPEEIQKIFDNSFYENDFGTVGVVTDSSDETLKVVEVTPYRVEAKYSDKRHPDEVRWAKTLAEDLARRDFTVNALALTVGHRMSHRTKIIDLYDGQKDLKNKIIRAVGEPKERFNEDALRILRAVRLAAELDFVMEEKTEEAAAKATHLLKMISQERIRDEFSKIIMSAKPKEAFERMRQLGILKFIVPELEEGIGVGQNKEHIYKVWEHNLLALKHAAERGYSLEVRMAALLHDVGKPRAKRGEGPDSTFYNHEMIGSKMAFRILSDLRYPKKFIEKVVKLVRWHLFFSDTEIITLSAVRRVVRNVGEENVWDLMKVRFCDRVGMGRPKEEPYRLRKYESMIEEALRDPLHVKNLKVDGQGVMKIAGLQPGPKVGFILHALLDEVLDDPSLNTEDYLGKRIKELAKLPEKELEKTGQAGKEKKEKIEEKEISKIRRKYGVK